MFELDSHADGGHDVTATSFGEGQPGEVMSEEGLKIAVRLTLFKDQDTEVGVEVDHMSYM